MHSFKILYNVCLCSTTIHNVTFSNCRNLLHIKTTFLQTKLLNSWFDEIFFGCERGMWSKNIEEYFYNERNFPRSQCGKMRNSLSQKKIFRQINYLVTYLVNPLLSRNFCQKCVRENSLNFCTTVWKNEKFTARQFFFHQINL